LYLCILIRLQIKQYRALCHIHIYNHLSSLNKIWIDQKQDRTGTFPWFILPITYHRSLTFHHPVKIDSPCCVGNNATLMFLSDSRSFLLNKLLERDYTSREKVHQMADAAFYISLSNWVLLVSVTDGPKKYNANVYLLFNMPIGLGFNCSYYNLKCV